MFGGSPPGSLVCPILDGGEMVHGSCLARINGKHSLQQGFINSGFDNFNFSARIFANVCGKKR